MYLYIIGTGTLLYIVRQWVCFGTIYAILYNAEKEKIKYKKTLAILIKMWYIIDRLNFNT